MKRINEHINNLIAKHLSKEASQEEIRQLSSWLDEHPDNKKAFDEYANMWEKINRNDSFPEIDITAEWEKHITARSKVRVQPQAKVISLSFVYKIAAVLVIALTVYAGFRFYSKSYRIETIAAGKDMREIFLPDSTKVTLNAYASVSYPADFIGKTRKVSLTGDAYFEVKKDSRHPFVIDAGDINVQVLGTSFYVNTKKPNNDISVIVTTGKVACISKYNKSNKTVLLPGEQAVYSKNTGSFERSVNKNPNFLAWKTHEFIFSNTALYSVMQELGDAYGAQITIEGEELNDLRLTGTYAYATIGETLDVICKTIDCSISVTDDRIVISKKK